jgi:hypothetical protein
MIAFLLALVPGGLALLNLWFKAKADLQLAKVNAYKDVGVAAVTAAGQEADGRARTWGVIGASKLLTWMVIILLVPIAGYEWKEIFVDKLIGPGCIWWTTWCWIGTTDPIRDTMVAGWMNTIIASLFGSSTVLAVAQLWWTTKP